MPVSAEQVSTLKANPPVCGVVADAVEQVLRTANREHPADSVLRNTLRTTRWWNRAEPAEVARAVFAYYRWLGWLGGKRSIIDQVRIALDLQAAYRKAPQQFLDVDLLAKAVPAWVHQEMDLRPDFVRALQFEPRLWLRAKPGQGRALAESIRGRVCGDDLLSDTLEYSGEEDLYRTEQFRRGLFEIQDISSQVVGLVCAPKPGETWLDACAGEGGKLLHLSALMGNRGLIWATDRAAWRLQVLKKRAARAQVFNYRTALWVEGARLPTRAKFDGILVDAPCSGIGTWQRNPHARWTATPRDVQELATVQRAILDKVASSLKPGGRLIYAVCTLTTRETTEVAQYLTRRADLKPMPISNPLEPRLAPSPHIQLQPRGGATGATGGNGMFIAGWRAVADSGS